MSRSLSILLTAAAGSLLVSHSAAQALTLLQERSGSYGLSSDGTAIIGLADGPAYWLWTAEGGFVPIPGEPRPIGVSGGGSVVLGIIYGGPEAGWLWTPPTGWQGLGPALEPGTLGCSEAGRAAGISDSGTTVVGTGRDAACIAQAFRWDADSGFQLLETYGSESSAYGISADGSLIVGNDYLQNTGSRAATWSSSGEHSLILVDPQTNPKGKGVALGASSDGTWVTGQETG